jgi:hypothetical protein
MASGLMLAKETIHDSTNECEDLAESFPGVWDAFFSKELGGLGARATLYYQTGDPWRDFVGRRGLACSYLLAAARYGLDPSAINGSSR